MSDGPSEAARSEHKKAYNLAAKKYPKLEIVDFPWFDVFDWSDKKETHWIRCMRVLDEFKRKCPKCGGTGKERVIYIHEVYIDHKIEIVKWPCRKCYGSGMVFVGGKR